jgi:hypothetical protein
MQLLNRARNGHADVRKLATDGRLMVRTAASLPGRATSFRALRDLVFGRVCPVWDLGPRILGQRSLDHCSQRMDSTDSAAVDDTAMAGARNHD